MPKINRLFFGFFLAVLGPSVLMLYANEPSTDIDSSVQTAQEAVRDPFSQAQPPEVVTPPEGVVPSAPVSPDIKVELQGIGLGKKQAYAVIGGEVFLKGDEKKGIKLLEVRKQEVDILANGRSITIPLFPDQELHKAQERAKNKGALKNASSDQQDLNSEGSSHHYEKR